jgi:hypothetical protein
MNNTCDVQLKMQQHVRTEHLAAQASLPNPALSSPHSVLEWLMVAAAVVPWIVLKELVAMPVSGTHRYTGNHSRIPEKCSSTFVPACLCCSPETLPLHFNYRVRHSHHLAASITMKHQANMRV